MLTEHELKTLLHIADIAVNLRCPVAAAMFRDLDREDYEQLMQALSFKQRRIIANLEKMGAAA